MLHGTVPLFFLRILLRILEILEMPFPSPLEVRAWDWTLRKRAWWQESPTEQTICVPWGGYHCLLVVLVYSFFGSSPPSLSWHIKSLKLKKLPFLDGSFSVCVLGVGRGDWLGLNLVFWTSLEYQVINYLTVLKFGVVPFMWYLVDECSVKVSHWLPYLCVVFDKGLKVFRCGQDSGTLLHCPLLGTRGTCGSEYPSILWWTWQKERINGMVSLVAQSVKNLPAVLGDRLQCSTPAFEKIPGEGNGNPLQFSCLGNPIDRSLAGCSPRGLKSQTRLSD